jgi:diadenosine tetraphosphatase ApaH/serine/threonine PP2A family protein phosphatase
MRELALDPAALAAAAAAEPAGLRRIAVLGGIYSNHLALAAALADARAAGAEAVYCLGDLGGFGPHPDRVFPLLAAAGVRIVQGNYDEAIAAGRDDCGCGYADPRDNYFAQISYDYTRRRTSREHRTTLAALPAYRRLRLGPHAVHLCHGSPRQVNEFLWETATPDALLERFCARYACDVLLVGHTGIKWERRLESGRLVVNVGAVGRPENDGTTRVWYALLAAGCGPSRGDIRVEFRPVEYDWPALAREMEEEGLPDEFVTTIRTGWWTTCLEILPGKERARGRF